MSHFQWGTLSQYRRVEKTLCLQNKLEPGLIGFTTPGTRLEGKPISFPFYFVFFHVNLQANNVQGIVQRSRDREVNDRICPLANASNFVSNRRSPMRCSGESRVLPRRIATLNRVPCTIGWSAADHKKYMSKHCYPIACNEYVIQQQWACRVSSRISNCSVHLLRKVSMTFGYNHPLQPRVNPGTRYYCRDVEE